MNRCTPRSDILLAIADFHTLNVCLFVCFKHECLVRRGVRVGFGECALFWYIILVGLHDSVGSVRPRSDTVLQWQQQTKGADEWGRHLSDAVACIETACPPSHVELTCPQTLFPFKNMLPGESCASSSA
jgi:hypothetical protein